MHFSSITTAVKTSQQHCLARRIAHRTAELESQGYRMLIKNKKEPWGQTVSRFLGPEGLLLGITLTPVMRQEE